MHWCWYWQILMSAPLHLVFILFSVLRRAGLNRPHLPLVALMWPTRTFSCRLWLLTHVPEANLEIITRFLLLWWSISVEFSWDSNCFQLVNLRSLVMTPPLTLQVPAAYKIVCRAVTSLPRELNCWWDWYFFCLEGFCTRCFPWISTTLPPLFSTVLKLCFESKFDLFDPF